MFTVHQWIKDSCFRRALTWEWYDLFYRYTPLTERSCANVFLHGQNWQLNAASIWSMEGSEQRRRKWENVEAETGYELLQCIPRNRRPSVCNNLLRETSQSLLTAVSDLPLCSQHHRGLFHTASRGGGHVQQCLLGLLLCKRAYHDNEVLDIFIVSW